MTRRFRLLRVLTLVVAGASLAGCVAYPAGSYGYGHGGYRSYAYSAPAHGGRGYGGGYGHGGGYGRGYGHGGWRGGWR